MANTLLRSGNLDSVLALGERGQAVYLSAMQLRETLRLRNQHMVSECLAVPQLDDEGKRLDWYTTREGAVTSWAAASDRARKQALNELENCQKAIIALCQKAEKSPKAAERHFGALLAHTLQFPDKNVVHLVGGKPVITFWGFVALDTRSPLVPLAMLREPEPVEEAPIIEPVVPAVQKEVTVQSLPEPQPVIAVAETTPITEIPSTPEPESSPTARRLYWRYAALLPVAAVVSGYFLYLHKTPTTSAESVAKSDVAEIVHSPLQWQGVQLPLQSATVIPPVVTEIHKPQETETVKKDLNAEKNRLVMPPDSLKNGTTEFLNGRWRVTASSDTTETANTASARYQFAQGKPAFDLRYQFNKGKGTVRVDQGEGVTCQANVSAAVMKTGNLIINCRTKARCSDGSRYTLPEITCKQSASGPADCSGQYDSDTPLTMIMKRESKK
ncbi:MAG: hypothetical protein XXXJIFNMEKO3_01468 [Candidatus Erwinia impunctatus]